MASARNNLLVGIHDNYQREAAKSISPIMSASMADTYELKEFHSNGGGVNKGVTESETDSNINLSSNSPSYSRGLKTISVSSNKARFSISRSAFDDESDNIEENRDARMSIGSDQTTDISVFAGSSTSDDTPSPTSLHNGENYESDDNGEEMDDIHLEYYCVDHMQLCSEKAIQENHGECENVISALEWADEQQNEKDRKRTESLLQKFDTFAGIMIDERKDLKRHLTERKEDVTEEALEIMEDMVTHLLKKQKEFTEKFEELHEGKMKMIKDQIKRCTMVQRETSTCMKQLAEYPSGTPEYQQVRKKVHDKCPVYEEILRRDFQASTRMDYEFVPNPQTEDIISSVKFLGDVIIRRKPSKLPGFLSQSRETDFSKRAVTNIITSDGSSSSDKNSCCFSGCTYITHGRIILADWNNNKLKMFNKNHIMVSMLEFESNPWDVKRIDDSKVVVTVPAEQRVYVICFAGQCLEIVTSFVTDGECWGVTPINGKFVVTCDPWSKAPSLKVFSDTGKQLAFFQKDSKGDMLFQRAQHIAADDINNILYISDGRQHHVLAITMAGQLVFRYRHEKLEYPTGVAVDNQGHLYICGKDSSNVHQLSKDGHFLRILFNKKDNIASPRGICFQPDGDKILVTDTQMPECQEFVTADLN